MGHALGLMERCRYDSALRILNGILDPSADYDQAVLLKARCFFEQGLIRHAFAHLRSAAATPLGEPTLAKCQLWLAYLRLYGVETTAKGEREPMALFEETARRAADDDDAHPAVRALAADLLARAAQWRLVMGWESLKLRSEVEGKIARAIQRYRALDDVGEALRAKHRWVMLCRHEPRANLARATALLHEIKTEATRLGCGLMAADASLELLEIEWERFLAAGDTTTELQPWIDRYAAVEALYRKARHAYGEAKVCWSFARLLLKYGFVAGVDVSRRCADELARKHEMVQQQAIWKALNLWHILHGEPSLAQEAQERSKALSATMDFPMAAGVDALGAADRAFRNGHYGEAETLIQGLVDDPDLRDVHSSAELLLVNCQARTGRTEQARRTLDSLIERLDQRDATLFMPEALVMRVAMCGDEDAQTALNDLQRLLDIDRADDNLTGLGQHYAYRAWTRFNQLRRRGEAVWLTAEVTADFDAAEAALANLRTLDARSQLGNVYQQRGQVAFMARQWETCGAYLTKAEHLFRALELTPALAFVIVHQGLALIEVGRSAGTGSYDAAKSRFAEAEQLFRAAGLLGMVWSAVFYQALCEREAGGWEPAGSEDRRVRWQRAQGLLLSASHAIDIERGAMRLAINAEAQKAEVAFAADKQTLYREGFQFCCYLLQDYGAAVQWLERNKGRALLDALAETVTAPAQIACHPAVLADMQLRERKRLAGSYQVAEALQQGIDEGLRKMAEAPETSAYAALRQSDPPAWEKVLEALRHEACSPRGRGLLIAQYYCSPERSLLFGMRAEWDQPRQVPLDVDYASLLRFVQEWFWSGNLLQLKRLASGERQWQRFASLLAPLAEWAGPGDRICLIPHGILHDIPLHSLCLEDRPLAQRNIVSYTSSLSVLYHLLYRRRSLGIPADGGRGKSCAVFGDPSQDLPGAEREARVIAGVLGCAPVLSRQVTRTKVLDALAQSTWFVYAGHGELVRADGFASGLKLKDGERVSAADVLALSRVAELVVLSACEVGASERGVGDELLGLVRALILAGAGAVVASQWRVNDEATAFLLGEFFRALQSCGEPAHALQVAAGAASSRPEWAHFYYWGGFVMHGIG